MFEHLLTCLKTKRTHAMANVKDDTAFSCFRDFRERIAVAIDR